MQEQVHLLGQYNTVVSIVSQPDFPKPDIAVLIFNAGIIHHIGPGNLHVHLARELAQAGVTTWRVDFSGLGDSPARPDHLPQLEQIVQEPREIIDRLQQQWGIQQFILVGICSGAYASFKTSCEDDRVLAAVLINPQDFVGDEHWAPYVQAQHYVNKSLYNPRAWLNLFTGRVNYKRLIRVLWQQCTKGLFGANQQAKQRADTVRSQMDAILDKNIHLLMVMSETDVSVSHMSAMFGCDFSQMGQEFLQTAVIEGADHLFSRQSDQQKLIQTIREYILALPQLQAYEEMETFEI